VQFVQQQLDQGLSKATINRRLAALALFFDELHLLDPDQFRQNPIQPQPHQPGAHMRRLTLSRRQPKRIPSPLTDEALRTFFEALPTWRDKALMLLMWVSCLRVSEVVALQFDDIECSRRRIRVRRAKGNRPRMVFMDTVTFEVLKPSRA
jgi:integrase/recombinase XerC